MQYQFHDVKNNVDTAHKTSVLCKPCPATRKKKILKKNLEIENDSFPLPVRLCGVDCFPRPAKTNASVDCLCDGGGAFRVVARAVDTRALPPTVCPVYKNVSLRACQLQICSCVASLQDPFCRISVRSPPRVCACVCIWHLFRNCRRRPVRQPTTSIRFSRANSVASRNDPRRYTYCSGLSLAVFAAVA